MIDNKAGRISAGNVQSANNSVNDVLRRNGAGASFQTLLNQQLKENENLKFSKHAQERIGQRGIEVSQTLVDSLEDAVSKARDKGAKDIVIIDSKGAFLVNIPNNTVITTMSVNEMKENIFTNIDSAVVI